VGAGVAVSALTLVHWALGTDATLVHAAFGSSAVLLFAAPNAPFSQPRNVVGGHVLSAAVGSLVGVALDHSLAAGPIAVPVAAGLMVVLRCAHPPAGGTALAGAVGATGLQPELFYVVPSLTGSVLLVATAVLFNNLVVRRPYPDRWN